MGGILAYYDITGIQSYVFATNKLRENLGADKLVGSIFGGDPRTGEGILQRVLTKTFEQSEKKAFTEWRTAAAPNPDRYAAEIIQSRGGHALVAFYGDTATTKFQEVTASFLRRVLDECGRVGIATAAVKTDFGDTYRDDEKELRRRMTIAKGFNHIPAFAGNRPITRQSVLSGLPVSRYNGTVKQDTQLKNEFPSDKLKQQTDGGKENGTKRTNSRTKSESGDRTAIGGA